MNKALKPSQAVLDFNRLEYTYNRATAQTLHRETLDFWISYYQRRMAEIAAIHKMDADDLIVEWLKWRAEFRKLDN